MIIIDHLEMGRLVCAGFLAVEWVNVYEQLKCVLLTQGVFGETK